MAKNADEPEIRLLESGYWHARWGAHMFAQWPRGRVPTMDDCFGDVSVARLDALLSALAALEPKP